MSYQNRCPWTDYKMPVRFAERARCPNPECKRRIQIREYRIRFHRLPARVR